MVATNTELVDYLKKLAATADGIPLVLYNPPHAKRVLQPMDYQLLKQIPEVIGVKVLSRDAEWVAAMKQYASHLSIFVPGHFLASGVASRIASGAYSNVACINPKAAQNWWAMMQTIDLRDLQPTRAVTAVQKQARQMIPYFFENKYEI